ncbi:exosome complex exonuclease Rrp41 [archaeon]|nr:exosome complex exonuclease Rrp41 [archaeon]|tara:strand:- start:1201 stop:1908 length:708 start_codon:yes stop_codon:yes gene_type:complete
MTYTKRPDGRKFDEPRKMEAKVGIIKRADGSAMFKMGDTIAIAAVYGPRELHPRFLQNPERGTLRCVYDMLSFSVPDRKRPGPSRRGTEISMVTENSLLSVVNLDQFPNAVVDVFINITQANAGTRCAGINAAVMALADAGIPMRDLVSAISVGKVGDKVVCDLDKDEEDYEEGSTDIPVAIVPRTGEVILLQLDGSIKKEELKEALKMAKKTCDDIYKIQKKALKKAYQEFQNE